MLPYDHPCYDSKTKKCNNFIKWCGITALTILFIPFGILILMFIGIYDVKLLYYVILVILVHTTFSIYLIQS